MNSDSNSTEKVDSGSLTNPKDPVRTAEDCGSSSRNPPFVPPVERPEAAFVDSIAESIKAVLRQTFISLESRNFARLWLGLLFMMGGLNMQMIARGYLVYDITGSAKLLGLVSAAGSIPILVLALFGGAIADRVPRKRVVQLGQGTSMVVALLIAVSIATGRITWVQLFVAGMVQGSMWAFMMPARQAFIPQLVARNDLANAVAISAAGMSMTTLLAPAVAGVLYGIIGPEGVYFLVSAMAFIAVILTSTITNPGKSAGRTRAAMLSDIGGGLSYIVRDRLVLVLLAISMAFVLLAMPVNFLMPVFVVDVYHRESEALGLLVSMMGVGALGGSLVIASLGRWRRGALIIGGGFVTGAALLMLASLPFYYAAAGVMVVMGVGSAAHRAINQAIVMEHIDDRFRGRVMSVYMMNFGLMPLGVLPMGMAIDVIGAPTVVAFLGLCMLAVTTVVLLTQKRLRSVQ